ncbi:GspH/FimT family pseudopilin [Algibacillus agarilyticus]|uniref:GspH/FimT family pseudopilin n=1 Tax=Algibacillus agarilyticus TaxID=2234133 RepID=UPI000DD09154|nr:GspH/FimT family pseudopilin [Algibacillus agarilyticus]
MKFRSLGFSLIELMVTLAIMGIAITLALPSLSATFTQSSVNSGTRALSKDLIYARGMAISNQLPVVVCHLSGTTCSDDNWKEGYTIFLDNNGDGEYDSATESKLRINEDFTYGTLSISNGANEVVFNAAGQVNTSVIFTYCPNIEKTYARGVVINQMGRAKMTQDYDGDSLDESSPSNNDSHLTCT